MDEQKEESKEENISLTEQLLTGPPFIAGIIFALISVMLFNAYRFEQSANLKKKYTIAHEKSSFQYSRTQINVMLKKKENKSTLKSIAYQLRNARKQFKQVYVFFHIPGGTKVDEMAWATSHILPDEPFKVIIYGASIEQDKIMLDKCANIKGRVWGRWKDTKMFGQVYVMYSYNSKILMKTCFFYNGNSSTMDKKLQQRYKQNKVIYHDGNKWGNYYTMPKNGNLGIYADGEYREAIKINTP